jgi:terminase small subunit-like protein
MRRRLGTAYGIGRETLVASNVRLPQLAIPWRERQAPAALRERPAYDALKRIKHRLFVDSFVIHGNASRAAREAGYRERDAGQQGWRLRQRPDIDAAIKEWLGLIGTRAERALERLDALANMPLAPYEEADPQLLKVSCTAAVTIAKLYAKCAPDADIDDQPTEVTMLEAGRRIAHVLSQAARIAKEREQEQNQGQDQEQD